ncbi:MAG: glycoside hydrolase family 3 protein, partial [Clostridia bacterium]|nr:glycoside hydrolase family 3 protein [Clostridia bacterium]
MQDKDGTVFPQCAGLGGSFDREAIHKMADIIGDEARAKGIRQVYAPCVDIPRDPRWGRLQESYGEDPYLVGEMGAQYVKGIQKHGVAACAKHFIAYGVPEGGINLAPAHIGEREIREVMLEP